MSEGSLRFDQHEPAVRRNLAPRLVDTLADLYPGSTHVRDLGLASADDRAVWDGAVDRAPAIVSKDSDFQQRSFVEGHPPKVIWRRLGNCSTTDIEVLLRDRHADVVDFRSNVDGSFLILA